MKVLILGANGQIARIATRLFLERTDAALTLYLRHATRLNKSDYPSGRVQIVEGDVKDSQTLSAAMRGHDVVYANLDGDLAAQAHGIIKAMHTQKLRRLIFVSSMGIYNEVPGQSYKSVLDPYRDAALAIEASDLDYTILRPEWLNNSDEINYDITHKGESFKNPDATVSRKSVADLIVKLATTPGLEIRSSLGIHRTN